MTTSFASRFARSAASVSSMSLALSSASRMFLSSGMTRPASRVGLWKREIEGRPAIESAFRPGAAAVALHDAANIGEPDPGPLEFVGAVEPLKYAEQLARILHVEADAVVADGRDDFPCVGRGRPDLDLGVFV